MSENNHLTLPIQSSINVVRGKEALDRRRNEVVDTLLAENDALVKRVQLVVTSIPPIPLSPTISGSLCNFSDQQIAHLKEQLNHTESQLASQSENALRLREENEILKKQLKKSSKLLESATAGPDRGAFVAAQGAFTALLEYTETNESRTAFEVLKKWKEASEENYAIRQLLAASQPQAESQKTSFEVSSTAGDLRKAFASASEAELQTFCASLHSSLRISRLDQVPSALSRLDRKQLEAKILFRALTVRSGLPAETPFATLFATLNPSN